jgi:hypothetical protein
MLKCGEREEMVVLTHHLRRPASLPEVELLDILVVQPLRGRIEFSHETFARQSEMTHRLRPRHRGRPMLDLRRVESRQIEIEGERIVSLAHGNPGFVSRQLRHHSAG